MPGGMGGEADDAKNVEAEYEGKGEGMSGVVGYREYNPDSAGTRRVECLVETHLDWSLVGKQRVNSWW